jgi:hypothetical protein
MRIPEGCPPKIGHKVTTIFFNRWYFIKKLSLRAKKNSVLRRKNGKKHGKKIGFYQFLMTKCRFYSQNGGKFPSCNL